MNKETLRLRMFAGPNGSGKSTFKSIIRSELIGIFINPDEIEKEIQDYKFLNFDNYEIQTTAEEVKNFFSNSNLLKTAGLADISRYQRSLDLLVEAIQYTNRAYIFDNSTHEHIWLAEITDGQMLEMKTEQVPAWFKKTLGAKFNFESKS